MGVLFFGGIQIGKQAEIHIWDTVSTRVLSVLKGGHTRGVCAVDFSADGKRLASVGLDDDHSIVLWDWKAGTLLAQTRGHKDKIFCIKWSPTADLLVTAGIKHLKFWTPAGAGLTGKRALFGTTNAPASLLSVAFGRDGTALAGSAAGEIFVFPPGAVAPSARVQAHDGPVFALTTVERGFMSGGKDGTVALWDPALAACVRRYPLARAQLVPGSAPLMQDLPAVRAVTLAKGRVYAGTADGEILSIDKDGPCRVVVQGHAEGEVWLFS
jgi:WD40 repeat protein